MLAINGHFKRQTVTGVQRYALEIVRELKEMGTPFRWVDPPERLSSDVTRQLWMQLFMPGRLGEGELLWSPTNTGPASCARQVLTLHDLADQVHPEWFSRRYVAWRSLILPRLLKRVRGVITISEYSRRSIVERYPFTEGKIRVIPNGVNASHFHRRPEEEVREATSELGVRRPYLVTVGSLDPRKNLNGLLKAWNRLPGEIRGEHQLVIAGGSSEKFAFRLEEEAGESVRFVGYVPYRRLPALYSGAKLFVYPSLFEGFGLPVLEAMACRVPVLTSDATALGDIEEGAALKADPEDAGALSEGMRRMVESDSLRGRYAEKGHAYARQFRWERAARQTLEFLGEKAAL